MWCSIQIKDRDTLEVNMDFYNLDTCNNVELQPSSENPDYKREYKPIVCSKQRNTYEKHLEAESERFQLLRKLAINIQHQAACLELQAQEYGKGTDAFKEIQELANQTYTDYLEVMTKFTFLTQKLNHIERMMLDYDALPVKPVCQAHRKRAP